MINSNPESRCIITPTDIKQYYYCPRIVFFEHCLPDFRPVTEKMKEGARVQEEEQTKEQRRKLRTYGFQTGDRLFEVFLRDEELGISAKVDLIIMRPDGANCAVPVDYKMSSTAGLHFREQVSSYCLLVERNYNIPCNFGFIYLVPVRKAKKVTISESNKQRVLATIDTIRKIIEDERIPDPTKYRGRCLNCEFRRICNDVP